MQQELIKKIEEEKLIVILRGIKKEHLLDLTNAMYAGGVRLLEITYSANGSVSDEETAENIKLLHDTFLGKMSIGAGTVLTEKQVRLTKEAGGEFIISPDCNKDVIQLTKSLGMISMPGCLTPSEMQQAHLYGADFVKLFPASAFNTSYIKAVKAPLSHIKMLAVGGVDLNNIAEYKKAGICGFGIGSNITDKKLIENGEYGKITELAKEYVRLIQS